MKFFFIVILTLISTSCLNKTKEHNNEQLVFNDVRILKLKTQINSIEKLIVDKAKISELESALDTLKVSSLIKGKRFNGYKGIGSLELSCEETKIDIMFSQNGDGKIIASFLKQDNGKSFIKFLGNLISAEIFYNSIDWQE